jgi:hypothetical protein
MAFFIFIKNSDNVDGTIYRIASNQTDLNNLNIIQSDYKIIEDSEENFNAVKNNAKQALKYNNNVITYTDLEWSFKSKLDLEKYIFDNKQFIQIFLDNNPNHPLFEQWNNYKNQLNSFNTNILNYPFNQSLETYFSNQSVPFLNSLQLP